MKCPKCTTEMDEVRKLDVIVDSCSRCGGMWLDAGELDKLRTVANDARAQEAGGRPLDRDDDHDLIGLPGWAGHRGDGHDKPKHKRKKSVLDVFEIFD